MLNDLSQQPPSSSGNLVAENIPDPWENTNNATKSDTEGWEAPVDIHPLICGEEKPELIGLPQPETNKLSPMQVLIEDGLKVKAYDYNAGQLKEHLKEALGLLSWIVNVPSQRIS